MSTDLEKPTPPSPAECCEGGCDPCVWDHYYAALELWKKQQKELKKQKKEAEAKTSSSR